MKKVSFIRNKGNIECNLNDFWNNTNNILYITGLSGSGKSTFSKATAEKCGASILPLDYLGEFYGKYKDSHELMKDIVSEFFRNEQELHQIIKSGRYMDLKLNYFEEYIKWNQEYIRFVVSYCRKHYHQRFIIEGTHLFMTMSPEFYQNSSMIILRTSAFSSLIRRLQRELSTEEKNHPLTNGKKHIRKLLRDAKRLQYRDVKKLNTFIINLK